jgi:predicted O-linked N-acetylglucosamine transferase (SPINDLY family)
MAESLDQIKAHLQAGRLAEAEAGCRAILSAHKNDADALHWLGIVLFKSGRLKDGAQEIRRAIEVQPGRADFYCNLGVMISEAEPAEAAALFRKALELRPGDVQTAVNLGGILERLGKIDESIAVLRRAVQLRPDFTDARLNLGNSLKEAGQMPEAIEHYRKAVELSPGDSDLHGNLVFMLHFDERCGAKELLAEHRRWAKIHAEKLRPANLKFENDANPNRRLRVGYVSADFRVQPVGRFILPLLAAHDRRAMEVFCYDTGEKPDYFTPRLRQAADVWREVGSLSDAEIAERIRADRIDILIDLNMHMRSGRLLVFARKPAPVQVVYLAYTGTTGLEAIDYRITDPYLDPPGSEGFYVEQSAALSRSYWCFQPVTELEESPLPAERAGYITFGALNNFCKASNAALEAWSRVLAAVPESRLIVFTVEGEHRNRLRERFARAGVEGNRIEFAGRNSMADYMKLYQRIDIALDSFPYAGGTTTCDALWMGVPVVTLAGQTAIGRGGVSILNNIGLPELVATSPEEYVRIAARLAGDRNRLSELRRGMRQRMLRSPLMDAKGFAADMENLYRQMWERWCGGSSNRRKGNVDAAAGHLRAGRVAEAESGLREILAGEPGNADAMHLLGIAVHRIGREAEGVEIVRRAIQMDGGRADFHCNLGVMLTPSDFHGATTAFRRALEIKPNFARAAANLGAILERAGEYDEAITVLRRALESQPDFPDALHNLGSALKETGEIEQAVDCFRRAAELNPNNPAAHSNLPYRMLFDPRAATGGLLAESRAWGRRYADHLKPVNPRFENLRDPERRLRIGYVSPDFRIHPIGIFMLPLLAAHHHGRFEIFCYSSSVVEDRFTQGCREHADVWRDVKNLSDAELAELIRKDRVDILIDLTMHMARSRLLTFARKPAPLQMTYLAYPGTTGVETIDYRITDPYLEPEGSDRSATSEKLVGLAQSYWCYSPRPEVPAVGPLPASTNGFVTFGSLNNFSKVNGETLRVWGRILRSVPNSRLRLLCGRGAHRAKVIERLGVDAGRVEFFVQQIYETYFQEYHRVDIGLDPFPYCGGTTTCDSLWMGVPVVTLSGRPGVGRFGASILTNVGLPELIGKTEDDYVRIAAGLAGDTPRINDLRSNLRERMGRSVLMDRRGFMEDIEGVYRRIWRKWCGD